jgi:hypothetical protein
LARSPVDRRNHERRDERRDERQPASLEVGTRAPVAVNIRISQKHLKIQMLTASGCLKLAEDSSKLFVCFGSVGRFPVSSSSSAKMLSLLAMTEFQY